MSLSGMGELKVRIESGALRMGFRGAGFGARELRLCFVRLVGAEVVDGPALRLRMRVSV